MKHLKGISKAFPYNRNVSTLYLENEDDITGINRNIKDCTIEEALASFKAPKIKNKEDRKHRSKKRFGDD